MTPAGPERNKQIAEKRGDRICHDFNLGGTCMYCAIEDTSNAVRDSVCPQKEIKPYSTDISCAMELWGEMRRANGYVLLSFNTGEYECITIPRNPEYAELVVYREGKDEADAISGCWLRWKNNE